MTDPTTAELQERVRALDSRVGDNRSALKDARRRRPTVLIEGEESDLDTLDQEIDRLERRIKRDAETRPSLKNQLKGSLDRDRIESLPELAEQLEERFEAFEEEEELFQAAQGRFNRARLRLEGAAKTLERTWGLATGRGGRIEAPELDPHVRQAVEALFASVTGLPRPRTPEPVNPKVIGGVQ